MPIEYTQPPAENLQVQEVNAEQENVLSQFFNYDHLLELLAYKERVQEQMQANGVSPNPIISPSPEIIGASNPGVDASQGTTASDGTYTAPNEFMNQAPGSLGYRNGVLRFQAEHNLTVDGVLGPMTKKVLHDPNFQAIDEVSSPPTNGRWVTINKTKRILTIYEGNQVYLKVPVAVGKSSRQTPSGKTSVVQKTVNPAWGGMFGEYEPVAGGLSNNPLGYRWLGFSGNIGRGYGMHGNAAPYSIGKEISNGCVRMINGDVEQKVFPALSIGTPVWLGTQSELEGWGVLQTNTLNP